MSILHKYVDHSVCPYVQVYVHRYATMYKYIYIYVYIYIYIYTRMYLHLISWSTCIFHNYMCMATRYISVLITNVGAGCSLSLRPLLVLGPALIVPIASNREVHGSTTNGTPQSSRVFVERKRAMYDPYVVCYYQQRIVCSFPGSSYWQYPHFMVLDPSFCVHKSTMFFENVSTIRTHNI